MARLDAGMIEDRQEPVEPGAIPVEQPSGGGTDLGLGVAEGRQGGRETEKVRFSHGRRYILARAGLLLASESQVIKTLCPGRAFAYHGDMEEPGAPEETASPTPLRLGLGARLRGYFFAGILVLAPISITVYIAWLLISFIDTNVFALIPPVYNPETYLPFSIPGIGVILMFVGVTLVGALTAGYLGRVLLRLSEGLLNRMPIVRGVYGAVKQIVETVLSSKSAAFREVVLVEYPRQGCWTIGFLTGRTIEPIGNAAGARMVNVFVPATPNPTSGFLLFVPESDVRRLSMSVEEGIKLVISVGIVAPPAGRVDPGTRQLPRAS